MRRALIYAWLAAAFACGRVGFHLQAGEADAAGGDTDATGGDTDADGELPPAFLLYTFDEGSGALVRDRGATGIDLTIGNPAAVQWESTGLRVFGASLQAGAPTAFYAAVLQSNAVSAEAWFVPDSAASATPSPRRIVALADDLSGNLVFGHGNDLGTGGAVWTSRVMAGGTMSILQTPSGTATAQLTHLVLVHHPNGDERIYLDGALTTQRAAGTLDNNWNAAFQLTVANSADGTRAIAGVLRRVALYAHALSDSEITTRFSAGPPGPP